MARLSDRGARLLLERNFASVATIRLDGTPHVSPVWIDYDGENVLFNTAVGRAKERHLRRDPRVTVQVFSLDDPYQWVAVSGTAELTHDGADAHIDKLSKKYFGLDVYPSREPGEQRVLVRVRPERVTEDLKDEPC